MVDFRIIYIAYIYIIITYFVDPFFFLYTSLLTSDLLLNPVSLCPPPPPPPPCIMDVFNVPLFGLSH